MTISKSFLKAIKKKNKTKGKPKEKTKRALKYATRVEQIKKFEEELIHKHGLKKIQNGGDVIDSPDLEEDLDKLGEQVLWLLRIAHRHNLQLSSNEISEYLNKNKKSIFKVMRKLTQTTLKAVIKNEKLYGIDIKIFGWNDDIPTIYKNIRSCATTKIR